MAESFSPLSHDQRLPSPSALGPASWSGVYFQNNCYHMGRGTDSDGNYSGPLYTEYYLELLRQCENT
jgi:hypothetical protein